MMRNIFFFSSASANILKKTKYLTKSPDASQFAHLVTIWTYLGFWQVLTSFRKQNLCSLPVTMNIIKGTDLHAAQFHTNCTPRDAFMMTTSQSIQWFSLRNRLSSLHMSMRPCNKIQRSTYPLPWYWTFFHSFFGSWVENWEDGCGVLDGGLISLYSSHCS